jgi:SPRY domain
MALVSTTLSPVDKNASVTLSNGNLTAAASASQSYRSEFGANSGKWYWEVTYTSGTGYFITGIGTTAADLSTYVGQNDRSMGFYNYPSNYFQSNGTSTDVPSLNVLATGEKIGIALDLDNGTLKFIQNNTVVQVATGLSGYWYAMSSVSFGTASLTHNFGATAFTNTVPSGYTAGIGFDTTTNITGTQCDYNVTTGLESIQGSAVTNFGSPIYDTVLMGGASRKLLDSSGIEMPLNLRNFIPSQTDFYIDAVVVPLLDSTGGTNVWTIGRNLDDTATTYYDETLAVKINTTSDPLDTVLTVTVAYASALTGAPNTLITYTTTKSALMNKEVHLRLARISQNLRLFVNGTSVGTSTTKIIVRPYHQIRIGSINASAYYAWVGVPVLTSQLTFYKATSGTVNFTPTYPTPRYASTTKFSNYLSNTNCFTSPDGKAVRINFPNECVSFNAITQNTGRYYFEITTSNFSNLWFGFINNTYTNAYNSILTASGTANRWITNVTTQRLPISGLYNGSVSTTGTDATTIKTIGIYLDTATKSWGFVCNNIDYGYVHIGMTGTSFKFAIGNSGINFTNAPEVSCNFGDSAFVYTPPYKYALGFYSTVTQLATTTPAMDSSLHGAGTLIKTDGLSICNAGYGISAVNNPMRSNFFKNSGKFYFEVKPAPGKLMRIGISSHTMTINDVSQAWSASGRQSIQVDVTATSGENWLKKNGSYITNIATGTTVINGAPTTYSPISVDLRTNTGITNVLGFAIDYSLGTVSVYFKSTISPFPVQGYTISGLTGGLSYYVFAELVDEIYYNSTPIVFNFGATAFELPVPSGYSPGFDSTGYFGYKGYVYNSVGAGISRRVIAIDATTGEKITEVTSDASGKFIISQIPTNQPNITLMAMPNSGEALNVARVHNITPGVITVP